MTIKVSYNQKQMLLIVLLIGAILYMLTQLSCGTILEKFSLGACMCSNKYRHCDTDSGWCSNRATDTYPWATSCGAYSPWSSKCTRSFTDGKGGGWKPGKRQPVRLKPEPNPTGGVQHSRRAYAERGLDIPEYVDPRDRNVQVWP